MKGIECTFFGSLGKDVELRMAKSGKAWASLAIVVDTGEQDADGRHKAQWIKVSVFGEVAERLANATKGTRLYTEGWLTLDTWNDKAGEVRHGLSCAAFTCQRDGSSNIGRNRVIAKQHAPAEPAAYVAFAGVSPSHCAGAAERKRPAANGRDDFEHSGGDPIPF